MHCRVRCDTKNESPWTQSGTNCFVSGGRPGIHFAHTFPEAHFVLSDFSSEMCKIAEGRVKDADLSSHISVKVHQLAHSSLCSRKEED